MFQTPATRQCLQRLAYYNDLYNSVIGSMRRVLCRSQIILASWATFLMQITKAPTLMIIPTTITVINFLRAVLATLKTREGGATKFLLAMAKVKDQVMIRTIFLA